MSTQSQYNQRWNLFRRRCTIAVKRLHGAVRAVAEPLEQRTLLSITLSASQSPETVYQGQSVQLNVSATTDSGTLDDTYTVNWGDGSNPETHTGEWATGGRETDVPTHMYVYNDPYN